LADAYLCPYSAEAFNMPALEAAACGLPVICTAGGPTDEFIDPTIALRIASSVHQFSEDGEDMQMLVPDHDCLVNLMVSASSDAGLFVRAHNAALGFAKGPFTWSAVSDALVSLAGSRTVAGGRQPESDSKTVAKDVHIRAELPAARPAPVHVGVLAKGAFLC